MNNLEQLIEWLELNNNDYGDGYVIDYDDLLNFIASLEAEPVEGELLNYKAVEIGETMKSGDIVLQKET